MNTIEEIIAILHLAGYHGFVDINEYSDTTLYSARIKKDEKRYEITKINLYEIVHCSKTKHSLFLYDNNKVAVGNFKHLDNMLKLITKEIF